MSNIFNMDNLFFRTMSRLVDLCWLNLLTLICCIPIVTAGASLSAMYYVLLRMTNNEEGYIARNFFREFKANFKKSTIVWLVCLVIIGIYISEIGLIRSMNLEAQYGAMIKVGKVAAYAILVILAMFMNYVFALIARYDRDLKSTVKNSFLLAIAYFPRTICMVVIWLFPYALLIFSNKMILFWFMFGFALPGFWCSQLLTSLFNKIEDAQEENNATEHEV